MSNAKKNKARYSKELSECYVKDIIRKRLSISNDKITLAMIEEERRLIIHRREQREFKKWKHFENGEEPEKEQICNFISMSNKIYIGRYQRDKSFIVDSANYPLYGKAWQPAPEYKPVPE